ncbi:hypothetical protein [Ruminococcus sp.]|uniref:hypothetical protein n=1 Tax=Ruminococcus sp. TaxID=41978 RepID=UPI0025D530C6|nr:hypothetical protein [Ruminococcus sp.]
MVSDIIMPQIKGIIERTNQSKIKWRPFQEYYDYYMKNDKIQPFPFSIQNEYTDLLLEESFYAEREGAFIFLLSSDWISGKDGSKSSHRELMIACSAYSEIITVPKYNEETIEALYSSIKKYWQVKCGTYNQEISDIFDVLSNFSTDY